MDAPQYVFGAQGFGATWVSGNIDRLMVALKDAGIQRFDTAALYPATNPGVSEKLLGEKKPENAIIDTKIMFIGDGSLSMKNIGKSINDSLDRLKIKKVCSSSSRTRVSRISLTLIPQIHTLYAHAPDRTVPIAEQAAYFDHYYRLGLFENLGLSNYTPAMVRAWMEVAVEEDFVMPSVYQGQYNVICRGYEDGLFPVLREFGIAFEATSPLAGGFLTGKLSYHPTLQSLEGTRFEVGEGNMVGALYRMWYDQPAFHDAMRELDNMAKEHDSTGAQFALRWLLFHSQLKSSDEVVIGPSHFEQLQCYLDARKAGPLPDNNAEKVNMLFPALRGLSKTIIEKGWWSL
jgi:aflatoxin B1 aldehyde reductase